MSDDAAATPENPDLPAKPDLPDRLSIDPSSDFHRDDVLQFAVGVRFRGVEKTNVYEYCVSGNWVRVEAGTARDRRGNPLTIKLTGEVEPYYK